MLAGALPPTARERPEAEVLQGSDGAVAMSLAESALVACVRFKGSGAFCVLNRATFQSSSSMTSRIIVQKNETIPGLGAQDPSVRVHRDACQCALFARCTCPCVSWRGRHSGCTFCSQRGQSIGLARAKGVRMRYSKSCYLTAKDRLWLKSSCCEQTSPPQSLPSSIKFGSK